MLMIYIIVYALMVSFFLIERFIRKGSETKTLEKTKYDKLSTNLVAFTFVTSYLILILTPILNHYKTGTIKMPLEINTLGILLMILGILIRIIAVFTLGRFYTRTLRKTKDHEIVSNGIYKHIRHPGYLGNILLFLGASVALGNAISIIILFVLVLVTYIYRIKVEEEMLKDIFGDKYKSYMKKTKKLLPFIY